MEQIAVDQKRYFSDVGAFLVELGDVIEVTVVDLNNVIICALYIHDGNFWDMGKGTREWAYDDLKAMIDPIRRATTLFSSIPSIVATTGGSKVWRTWRWQVNSPGVWMLHWYNLHRNRLLMISHITGRIRLGLQTMVTVGRTD